MNHDELDQRVRTALAALTARREPAPRGPARAVRRDGRQPAARHPGATDARARPGLLHDRLGGSRVERARRRPRCGRATRRCCTTARAPSTWPASLAAGRKLEDGVARRAARHGRRGRRSGDRGGRHKVFGDPDLAVIPQTSTIASHLPRAVGVAFAIDRARRLGVPTRWPRDAVAVCSFGDASLNHSTAVGALNTAGYCVQHGLGLPLLLVCEDNGLGISVSTPRGWVAEVAQAARHPVPGRRRRRHRARASSPSRRPRRPSASTRPPGAAAPAHGALPRSRRHRRRERLPDDRARSRRPGPRSAARARAAHRHGTTWPPDTTRSASSSPASPTRC